MVVITPVNACSQYRILMKPRDDTTQTKQHGALNAGFLPALCAKKHRHCFPPRWLLAAEMLNRASAQYSSNAWALNLDTKFSTNEG